MVYMYILFTFFILYYIFKQMKIIAVMYSTEAVEEKANLKKYMFTA